MNYRFIKWNLPLLFLFPTTNPNAGNSKRGKAIWAWGRQILCDTYFQWNTMAILLLGSNWSHILCIIFALWYYNCHIAACDRVLGCSSLPWEVPCWKGHFSHSLSMGIYLLLLWRAPTNQEKRVAPVTCSIITKLIMLC